MKRSEVSDDEDRGGGEKGGDGDGVNYGSGHDRIVCTRGYLDV